MKIDCNEVYLLYLWLGRLPSLKCIINIPEENSTPKSKQ